ncbi:hypothetical protein Y032_0390g554 [Ancylostoma ceylanicum]|uniref:Uncharacterized protein n=1 Tax=Ancylostoma ceylanicum TaxID=53326 RepID=A0A016RSU8_9BILA|nr:hypothetical protein Y032_0390g554 [Ancylostoma ceylanicum]
MRSCKGVVIFVLSTLKNPSRHVLTYPRTKREKIDKIDKSIPSPKTVVIFRLNTLKNPSRRVVARPRAKVKKKPMKSINRYHHTKQLSHLCSAH